MAKNQNSSDSAGIHNGITTIKHDTFWFHLKLIFCGKEVWG